MTGKREMPKLQSKNSTSEIFKTSPTRQTNIHKSCFFKSKVAFISFKKVEFLIHF